jgi:anti-anti-sigma factor
MPATVEARGDRAFIILAGEFDFSTSDDLGNAIESALNIEATQEIIVDLTETTFIDSSVIRILLKLREAANNQHKLLTLANCNDRIREIFVIGGFDQMFVIL